MPEISSEPVSPAIATRWIARAPGRVNLIGEHVDYNDGWVLPMAMEREVMLRATRRADRLAVFTSRVLEDTFTLSLDGEPCGEIPPWGRYFQGVVLEFQRATGTSLPGFDALIDSTIPQGGGLSSSAALCVATATLLEKMTGHRMAPVDKALLCQKVEHEYAGVPCGVMDQMASVLCRSGHLLLLDCQTNEARHIPFCDPDITVLVAHSGVSHALADGAYALRRAQCAEVLRHAALSSFRALTEDHLERMRPTLDDTLYRRARHVITENQRTLTVADAIPQGDWDTVGRQLYASHASLAKDYEVSCPELDRLVQSAWELGPENGVIGSRMTGGGFGGCTITLVRRPFAERTVGILKRQFKEAFGYEPACFLTQAAEGAE